MTPIAQKPMLSDSLPMLSIDLPVKLPRLPQPLRPLARRMRRLAEQDPPRYTRRKHHRRQIHKLWLDIDAAIGCLRERGVVVGIDVDDPDAPLFTAYMWH